MIEIDEFAKKILGIELYPYQEEVLRQLRDRDKTVFARRKAGRQILELFWDEYQQFKKLKDFPV